MIKLSNQCCSSSNNNIKKKTHLKRSSSFSLYDRVNSQTSSIRYEVHITKPFANEIANLYITKKKIKKKCANFLIIF